MQWVDEIHIGDCREFMRRRRFIGIDLNPSSTRLFKDHRQVTRGLAL